MACFVWFVSRNHPYVHHKHTTGLVSVLKFVVHVLLVNTCPAAIACCFTCPSYHLVFFALHRGEKSELEGAGLRKLEGFMFLNHSQSVIQLVHPVVSLLPQPLSSSPAI